MIKRSVIAVWLACCVAVLSITLYTYDPISGNDAGIVFAGLMMVLTFPSGLLVSGFVSILTVLSDSFGLPFTVDISPEFGFVVLWVMFCIVGYFQWFFVVPYLRKRLNHS